ncbi:MAG: PhoH family protein [Bradymonadales bacterium]
MSKIEIEFKNIARAQTLFGEKGVNLKFLENSLGCEISTRGNLVSIGGEERAVEQSKEVLTTLYELAKERRGVGRAEFEAAVGLLKQGERLDISRLEGACVLARNGKFVHARNEMQRRYLEATRDNDLVFAVGPAGTGKTYLAMAMAVDALLRHEVKRIVLVRPAVEAGERLGFLPGDMAEKVNPYLRPLFDALYDMVELERAQRWISQGSIELAPLAFMRGRTLNKSFVILDEAQNATIEQMKMFLTRLGNSSKALVTGDLSQSDLGSNICSGLEHAIRILEGIEGIETIRFSDSDIVRHPLVQRIVLAYERDGKMRRSVAS